MAPQQRSRGAEQFADKSRAQRFPAYHRANATDRNKVRSRYGSAAPEKQGYDPETFAGMIHGKRSKLIIMSFGQCTQEKPVMITGHSDTLPNLGFVCLLIV
jgi:hypothetical protein